MLHAFILNNYEEKMNVMYSYSSLDDFQKNVTSAWFKVCKLSPFVCRIKNRKYQFGEKEYKIEYKQTILQHSFFSDFIFFNEIIVEAKAIKSCIDDVCVSQTLNYLRASGCRVGLIINFGRKSLEHQRLIC